MGRIYYVQTNSIEVSDAGDFIQLRGGASRKCIIKEIKVWQDSATTLAMETVRIHRGTGAGNAGVALTVRSVDITSAAAVATSFRLPTADVSTLDLDIHDGWNILQAYVWLPTPEIEIEVTAGQDLGISILNGPGTTITKVGASIFWEEIGV